MNQQNIKDIEVSQIAQELILGFVQLVGTDLTNLRDRIKESAKKLHAHVEFINLTEVIEKINLNSPLLSTFSTNLDSLLAKENGRSSGHIELSKKMHSGSLLRQCLRNDVFSLYGMSAIFQAREKYKLSDKVVYILDSLKHPAEVNALRECYGDAFILLGISAKKSSREVFLRNRKGMKPDEAAEVISRDENERDQNGLKVKYGQKAIATFEQSDYFFDESVDQVEVDRFFEICFGNSKHTPSPDETFMHIAGSAATQSGDLSRQVGAAMVSPMQELLSVGKNEVPKFGGGQYSNLDDPEFRDVSLGLDPNERRREEIKIGVDEKQAKAKDMVDNLIEFHRTVHAEMEAIISCARKGISTVGATLFTTTYPCHNCAKHLVNAGVKRVVFIEAYPKSLATDLHSDSIIEDTHSCFDKMVIERYRGAGPRRYIDFYSLGWGSGVANDRKGIGQKPNEQWKASIFDAQSARPKFPLRILSAKGSEISSIRLLLKINLFDVGTTKSLNELLTKLAS